MTDLLFVLTLVLVLAGLVVMCVMGVVAIVYRRVYKGTVSRDRVSMEVKPESRNS